MKSAHPAVLDLAAIGGADAGLVGHKALRLAELMRAGFPVPGGFCLTTVATGDWGEAARKALRTAYRRLGGRVSVRSSALEEDGSDASYAGVYHSELPVEGDAQVLAAVERCLESWHAPQARAYRRLHGDARAPVMAVVVQRLVAATTAGVAYTRDPLRAERNEVHINSLWGLGEPLASGRASGDLLSLTRRGKLLERRVAHKPSALDADGERAVAPELRDAPSLGLGQARRVMLLALAAERHFGAPQDVEFAFDGERLWILQSRPLARGGAAAEAERQLASARRQLARRWKALHERGVLRGAEMVLSNGNIGELLPTPSAMSFGLFRHIFAGRHGAIANGRRRLGYLFDPALAEHLYELVAGQPYFNLEIDAATFDFGVAPPIEAYLARVAADPTLANYPELRLYEQHLATDPQRPGAALGQAFRASMCEAAAHWRARFAAGLPAEIEYHGRVDWAALDAAAAARQIARLMRFLRSSPCVVFVQVARLGFYFAARVRRQLLDWCGPDGEARCAQLLTGLPGSVVTQQALDLEALAGGALSRDTYLERYGHTATNELELSEPRLAEQPARLDALLAELRASGRAPAAEFASQQLERAAAERRIRRELAARGIAPATIDAFAEDLLLAQSMLPLRETVKHHYTAVHAEIRRGLRCMARWLDWPEERIFDLLPRELAAAAREPARLRALAERRGAERRIARRLAAEGRLPAVIFASRAEELGTAPRIETAGAWRGSPLSPGLRRGVVRVLREDGQLPELTGSGDEILVLRSANLGIAPVLRTIAGLVVEVGGLLAHAACQAREAGIPAITLADATRLLAEGSRVLIDGGSGRLLPLSCDEGTDASDSAAL